MFSFIKRLFDKPNQMVIDQNAKTIPEAFGYPEPNFNMLVNDLVNCIQDEDRLGSFSKYIVSPQFSKLALDLNNSKHSAVLGYAFCTAIIMQRDITTQMTVKKVLNAFYPNSENDHKNHAN